MLNQSIAYLDGNIAAMAYDDRGQSGSWDKTGPKPPRIARTVFQDKWIVLRRVGGPRLPIAETEGVARALRAALLQHLEPNSTLRSLFGGPRPSGQPTRGDPIALVPLPFAGQQNSDGALLGVAIVLSRELGDQERDAVLRALRHWETRERLEDEETPRISIYLRKTRDPLELERLLPPRVGATLRAETWCRPSRLWASVTPVALDHNPGELRTRDPQQREQTRAAASESIALACERVGLPRPIEVRLSFAPLVHGGTPVGAFPAFPAHNRGSKHVRIHARLRFETLVRGPVLIGAGRYQGVGLFRPLRED